MEWKSFANDFSDKVREMGFKAPKAKVSYEGKLAFDAIYSGNYTRRLKRLNELFPGAENIKLIQEQVFNAIKKMELLLDGTVELYISFYRVEGFHKNEPDELQVMMNLIRKYSVSQPATEILKEQIELIKPLLATEQDKKLVELIELTSIFEPEKARYMLNEKTQEIKEEIENELSPLLEMMEKQIMDLKEAMESEIKQQMNVSSPVNMS